MKQFLLHLFEFDCQLLLLELLLFFLLLHLKLALQQFVLSDQILSQNVFLLLL
jgi:hypothetical protein